MRLTHDEIILLAAILLALAIGSVVKIHRDHLRLTAPPTVASPTPPRRSKR